MKYLYLTIVGALLGTTAASAQTAPPRQDEANVDDIVVTAQRSRSDIVASGHQVTTIDQSQIELARSASDTLATILAKTVPGLADSSRTITDFGQTLRGRGALILVDGVPYNTNRDSARGLIGLEPSDIAQVQVLRGSSAMYGSGATGGIISINTRPAGGPLRAETVLAGTGSLSNLTTDSLGAGYSNSSRARRAASTSSSTAAISGSAAGSTATAIAARPNPARATCSTATYGMSAARPGCASAEPMSSCPPAITEPISIPISYPTPRSTACPPAPPPPAPCAGSSLPTRTSSTARC
ncbi:TonB-dependent receptor plug domain-containing protein [Sphingomonas sp. WKB10]|nr:TonB-dependent receptor plug domain-containing protein [Sphingomonas sp. WKB10]